MCQVLVIQVSLKISERREFDSRVYAIKILFDLNSQGNEKFELFSQGTCDFPNFGNEPLLNADYENVKKSAFGCCKILAQRKHFL